MSGTIHTDLSAELARLRAENAALKTAAATATAIRFKVGEKGGISMFGLNARFPVTLYLNQWERVYGAKDALFAFAKANEAVLSKGKAAV